MLRRNGPVIKSAESVVKAKETESIWGKICEIGFEPGVQRLREL